MCTISLILNMIAFVYFLNICEYDVPDMYIMIVYMHALHFTLSLSISLSQYDFLSL